MRCGRVSDMKTQTPFETLAALFEGSGASGAERAYKRAVENLTLELVKLGQLYCVRLKQISIQREGKKTTAAYAYQVDNGGECGEIRFDLLKKQPGSNHLRRMIPPIPGRSRMPPSKRYCHVKRERYQKAY